MKWRAILRCSAAKAFATSLLELRGGLVADGDTLPSHEVESTSRYGALGFLSHFLCANVDWRAQTDIFSLTQ